MGFTVKINVGCPDEIVYENVLNITISNGYYHCITILFRKNEYVERYFKDFSLITIFQRTNND